MSHHLQQLSAVGRADTADRPRSNDHAQGRRSHGHSHRLVDPSLTRSRAGLRVVAISLALLAMTAAIQAAIYIAMVLTILASAITAGVIAVERIVNPLPPEHLLALGLGLAIAALILHITWQSWHTVRGHHRHHH